MDYLYRSEVINYEFAGHKKTDTILFLHGWGGDKNSFIKTINFLSNNFNIITITLPTTKDTNLSFDLNNYAEIVLNILNLNNITDLIIICHSFGLRVATLLNQKISIKKIIITGGAGIKNTNFLKKIAVNNLILMSKHAKFDDFIKIYKNLDYSQLSHTNKKTFKKIINFDLKNLIKFDCPVLLFWGKKDTATPIKDAKYIYKHSNSKLIISKFSHFAYLEDNDKFLYSIRKFLYDNN